jgi:Uma2 family endonuclease
MIQTLLRADGAGIRLEIARGIHTWEPTPFKRHQKTVDQIRATILSACACVHYADIYVAFPDGSLKRPDIAIFCREPDEKDEAVTLVPEAVIEVISQGYEEDLELGPMFHLSQGVKDVVVLDPRSKAIIHSRRDGVVRLESPARIQLECGCECRV